MYDWGYTIYDQFVEEDIVNNVIKGFAEVYEQEHCIFFLYKIQSGEKVVVLPITAPN